MTVLKDTNPPGQSPRKTKLVLLAVAAIILTAALWKGWLVYQAYSGPFERLSDSWVFKENREGPVIGDLGGVPVSIPKPYANFVEYDGDPHFLEKRKGPIPKRTHESKLASFGFEVRYPDMANVNEETASERRQKNIHNTMWMRVGVNSHSAYGGAGDEFLDKRVLAITDPKAHRYAYKPLPEKVHGLIGYYPVGPDESKRLQQVGGADMNDVNLYYFQSETGQTDTYIECSNMAHAAAQCEQVFNLRPEMRIHVTVGYRRDLLPHWREIQSSVSKVILGFRVSPAHNENTK